jgi:hypothetical protein
MTHLIAYAVIDSGIAQRLQLLIDYRPHSMAEMLQETRHPVRREKHQEREQQPCPEDIAGRLLAPERDRRGCNDELSEIRVEELRLKIDQRPTGHVRVDRMQDYRIKGPGMSNR